MKTPKKYNREASYARFHAEFPKLGENAIELKDEEARKKKEWQEAEGRVNIQNQKVERAYEWLEYFKK